MIVVTGGTGFIGSNIVHGLNDRGHDDIVVVDNLQNGGKFRNISSASIVDYIDHEQLFEWLDRYGTSGLEAIFHLGACSDTTEWDGRYMMENNYTFSKRLLNFCLNNSVPFIYASSAAVYGGGVSFKEQIGFERPINVYGYSKALFDQYAYRQLQSARSQVVGLRYFNVYGPREQHKGKMASVAFHHYQQIRETGAVRLFEGCQGYKDGDQRRDFVHVDDAVNVNLWLLDNPAVRGVFNCGTGVAEPFNEIAKGVITYFGSGQIHYVPFPDGLQDAYQAFTQADMTALRAAGYEGRFRSVADGVVDYMAWLDEAEVQVLG